jgi:hypothetical protein
MVILVEGGLEPKLEHNGTSIKIRKNKGTSNHNPTNHIENYIV